MSDRRSSATTPTRLVYDPARSSKRELDIVWPGAKKSPKNEAEAEAPPEQCEEESPEVEPHLEDEFKDGFEFVQPERPSTAGSWVTSSTRVRYIE
jgi:hypothetical protein